MKILVTGAGGFIGKNLTAALRSMGRHEALAFRSEDRGEQLQTYCSECDFVFHLAGVNRPKSDEEFETGNTVFSRKLSDCRTEGSRCPVVFASSIQAELNNPYGRSKRAAEAILQAYGEKTGAPVYLYRLPNVFGKWCRPNYNSVIATFCHNTANGLPVRVDNADQMLRLVYIDDVVEEFVRTLNGEIAVRDSFCTVPEMYQEKLGNIADMIQGFSRCAEKLEVPNLSDAFTKKLYSTYLSYLPESRLKYSLTVHQDVRGAFAEFMRTEDSGQFSVNVTRPGCIKGNHWHHTKHEIFLAVSGEGIIRLRRAVGGPLIEIPVRGSNLEPVVIPPGYTHMLENSGDTDLITVMWASECYDPQRPDTFYLDVQEGATWRS